MNNEKHVSQKLILKSLHVNYYTVIIVLSIVEVCSNVGSKNRLKNKKNYKFYIDFRPNIILQFFPEMYCTELFSVLHTNELKSVHLMSVTLEIIIF